MTWRIALVVTYRTCSAGLGKQKKDGELAMLTVLRLTLAGLASLADAVHPGTSALSQNPQLADCQLA